MWRPLPLRWPRRGLPRRTCHPTPRKRAAPSRLLFVPPPGSALGRRLLPRRAMEVRGTALGPTQGLLRFRPSGPLRTRALFAWFLPCGLRAELGGGGVPHSEPAQVSVGAGPGGARSGRGRGGRGGRPGANRAGVRAAAGRPAGLTGQGRLLAPPRPPSVAPTRPFGPGLPGETAAPAWWPGRGGRVAECGLCLASAFRLGQSPAQGTSGIAQRPAALAGPGWTRKAARRAARAGRARASRAS